MLWRQSLLLKPYPKLDLQNITNRSLFPRDSAKERHSITYRKQCSLQKRCTDCSSLDYHGWTLAFLSLTVTAVQKKFLSILVSKIRQEKNEGEQKMSLSTKLVGLAQHLVLHGFTIRELQADLTLVVAPFLLQHLGLSSSSVTLVFTR